MYGTYQKFDYNTCPIRFPVGKAAKLMLYVFVFALMVVAGVAVFAAVHMLAVAALSVLASVLAVIGATLTAVLTVVVTVSTVLAHAAAFAVTTLAAVAVRCVVVLALVRALPVVWRSAVAMWAHRDGLLIAVKGLALAGIVISVFVVALVWLPVVLTACCTVLPQVATVVGVFGGAIGLMKVG